MNREDQMVMYKYLAQYSGMLAGIKAARGDYAGALLERIKFWETIEKLESTNP